MNITPERFDLIAKYLYIKFYEKKIKSNFFIELSFENLNAKIKSLSKYESQKNRIYFSKGYFSDYAKFRGGLVDLEYAEVFEVIRKIQRK